MYRIVSLFVMIAFMVNMSCSTPLDDYVNTPDPNFAWKLLQTYPSALYTVYILNMTSQQWLNDSYSSQPIWWHYMIITVPKVFKRPNNAFLMIGGGHTSDPVPTGTSTIGIVLKAGTVAVELQQIPNQPITFKADPSHTARNEDDIIAWLWRAFIETNGSDPHILLRLPMTKAVVRAMDATQQFLRQQELQAPEKFFLAGFSKRGWTTWTTAGVANNRVIGALPIVMDMINQRPYWKAYYRSLAGWSFALGDYYSQNITRYLDNPYFQVMADIIDPYAYFDRYRNIKILQIQAADDQVFPVDSEDFFWDDLQKATGGSFLRRLPNADHHTGYSDSVQSFYLSACDNATLPSWTWTRTINETHGQILANISIANGHLTPINVTVYQARTVNGTKRDFRSQILDPTTKQAVTNPVKWVQMNGTEISHIGQSIIYNYVTPIPPDGHWDGIFMQVAFPGPENTILTLTTETLIIPNTYPIGPCSGEECHGTLV